MEVLYRSEITLRRGGCNTGDQNAFCRGMTDPDRGASSPPPPNIPNPGISGGIPYTIDCPIRALAYKYAERLQGRLRGASLKSVYDALQLGPDCGLPDFVPPALGPLPDLASRIAAHPTVLHVA